MEKIKLFFQNLWKKVPKRKCSVLLIFVLFLLFIGIIFYSIGANYKYVFIRSFYKWSENFKVMSRLNDSFSQVLDGKNMNSVTTFQIDSPYLDDSSQLNDLSLEVNTAMDSKNKKILFHIIGKKQEQNIKDVLYLNQNKKQYLLLKDINDSYIHLKEEFDPFVSETQDFLSFKKEFDYLLRVLEQSLRKNIHSSYIQSVKEDLNIDGNLVKTKKMTLVIDQNNGTEFLSNIIKDIQKDQRTSAFLTTFYPEFQDYKVKSITNKFSYSVFIQNWTHQIVKSSIRIDDLEMSYYPMHQIYELLHQNDLLVNAQFVQEKNGFAWNILKDSMKVKLSGKKEKNNLIYQVNISNPGVDLNGTYRIMFEGKKKKSNFIKKLFTIDMSYFYVNLASIKIETDMTISDQVDITDIDDFISIDSLTEEEQDQIRMYLNPFISLLQN